MPLEPGAAFGPYKIVSSARLGRPVDKRTDIWAFGCVLYELLAGRLAFGGDTAPDTIAAILGREPDWRALPAATPVGLRRLLERCLEKDPKQRLRDIGDAQAELHEESSVPASRTPAPARPRSRGWIWPVAAAVLLAGLVPLSVWQRNSEVSRQNPLATATFERLTDFDGSELDAAISPDGKFVVFLSDRAGPFDAFVTQVGSGAFVNLTKGQVRASSISCVDFRCMTWTSGAFRRSVASRIVSLTITHEWRTRCSGMTELFFTPLPQTTGPAPGCTRWTRNGAWPSA